MKKKVFSSKKSIEAIINGYFFVFNCTNRMAWITFKSTNGKKDFVRLLFGAIALLFCLRVFFLIF